MSGLDTLRALLDAADSRATQLGDDLRAALSAVPDEPRWSGVRGAIEVRIKLARQAGESAHERGLLAEAERPKGPIVEVCYPSRHGNGATVKEELAEVTSGSLVMRRGARYSRKTGRKAGHTDRWTPCPYITEAELARVLALPRPLTTQAKKAIK